MTMATNKKASDSTAQPKWIAVIATVVALSGAAYQWFSHFQPKPDPPKPTAVLPVVAPVAASSNVAASSVNATAPGAIAIGTVGGNVNIGGTANAPATGASKAGSTK